jgi:hypothetical protein
MKLDWQISIISGELCRFQQTKLQQLRKNKESLE